MHYTKLQVFYRVRLLRDTTRKRIRTKLELLKPFTEVIVNYRKDNTPYKCEVKIIPLYKEKVTHFLAIEKKVV